MNFDLFIDRKPTESLKWNCYPDDVLPLWVADTDFLSPPAVVDALHKRVDHGIFGYGLTPEGLDQVVIDGLNVFMIGKSPLTKFATSLESSLDLQSYCELCAKKVTQSFFRPLPTRRLLAHPRQLV